MANTISNGVTVTTSPTGFSSDFEEMQDRVYWLIDEAPGSLFPRSIIQHYINEGLYEVARQTGIPLVRQTFTTPLSPTDSCTLSYPILSRNSAIVSNVRYDDALLELIDEDDISDKTTTGTPRYYFVDGGTVKLWPVPSESAKSIVIEYVKEPTALTGSDEVSELNASAQELACVWAAAKAKGKDDEYNYRDRLMADFADGIARLTGPLTGFYK